MVQEAAPMKALPSANARPARKGMISVCFKGHMYMSAPPEFISKKKRGFIHLSFGLVFDVSAFLRLTLRPLFSVVEVVKGKTGTVSGTALGRKNP